LDSATFEVAYLGFGLISNNARKYLYGTLFLKVKHSIIISLTSLNKHQKF
jgi:hypothetical protein